MALIVPRFRRESWYGRLYLRAYGADRGWVVRLMRMTGTTGFGYAPYPTLTLEMPEAEQLMTLCNWRAGREDAYARCLPFLMSPPPVQPFVEDGAKVSICPTFWKIVFALFVYCPIAAMRAVGHAIATTLRTAGSAIASAFRWVGRRYGRPIEYTAFSVLAIGCYAVVLYSTAFISYGITGHLMGRQGISQAEADGQAAKAENEQWRAGRREEIRQDYLGNCARRIREHVEYAKERTWQPDLECSSPDYGRLAHEEYARQCVGHDEFRLAVIEQLEGGDFNCANGGWGGWDLKDLFPAEADRNALAAWLGKELRKVFADELKAEIIARERRLAEARKRDAAIIGTTTVALLPVQQNPAELYRRFREFCEYHEDTKAWEMLRGSGDEMTNATCATLAGLFREQIDSARSAIRWQAHKAAFRQYAPSIGAVLGLGVGAMFIIALLIVLLDRYGQPILRALEWFAEGALFGFKWMAIIVFAPIWVPMRYLVWPALKLIGRAWMLVWDSGPVARVRAAIDAALTATARAVERFFAAIGQILADTWHLIRAFASAKWERLCPFIEWQ